MDKKELLVYLDNCCFNRPNILRDSFDYTEWQRGLYKDMPLDDFLERAQQARNDKTKREE